MTDIKRKLIPICAAAALFVPLAISAKPAAAAVGPTVENSYILAHATSNCSVRHVGSAVHIKSKRWGLDVNITAAGLYRASGGSPLTSTGMQGYPTWTGNMYFNQTVHWGWYSAAPAGGSTVKFYVDTPFTTPLVVPVTCNT